jgi:protein-tyrosine phosphatase
MPLSWQDGPVTQEHAGPMLVHCSAGCGRTGAFCTVDSVIDLHKRQKQHMLGHSTNGTTSRAQSIALDRDSDGDISMNEGPGGPTTTDQHRGLDEDSNIDTGWLDDDGIDLISQTVEDFRGQRLSMVQSLRQFVLCYETVLEWIRRLQESGGGGADARGRGRSGSLAF